MKILNWVNRNIKIVAVAVVLCSVAYVFAYLYFNEKSKSKRLFGNLQASQQQSTNFTTRDGHQASKKEAYQLTGNELVRSFPAVNTSLKNLDISPRRTESFTEARQVFEAEITAPVKDSVPAVGDEITYQLGKIDRIEPMPVKTFAFSDAWISVSGTISDSARLKIAAVDTVFTAIYRGERRRPWAWILSKRKLEVAATNRSPYIKINVIQGGIIKNQ